MPTFAELRARAESAANTAKETANSKIADYRGDKKPEKPVYKAPPRRPAVKPPVPPETSRPRVAGYDVNETVPEEVQEEEKSTYVQERRPVGRAALGRMVVEDVGQESQGKGIEVLLQNKELFFQFLDEFFAAKGFDVQSRIQGQEQLIEEPEEAEPEEEEEALQEGDPITPTKTHDQIYQPDEEEEPEIPLPSSQNPPQKAKEERSSSEHEETRAPIPPAPRRLPPPMAHKSQAQKGANAEAEADADNTLPASAPRRIIPPAPTSPKPSPAVQAIFSNLHAWPSSDPAAAPTPPARPIRYSLLPTQQKPPTPAAAEIDEPPHSPPPAKSKRTSRISSLLHKSSFNSVSASPTPTHTPSPPPTPSSTRPPLVNRASRPTAPSRTAQASHEGANTSMGIGAPPSTFFTGETNEEWTPPLPYGYMPSAGRKVTEGQCSAAQLCSYFASTVPWDSWYTVEDTSVRPASIVDRVEARWKGSVLYSQETKRHLFGAGKTKNERTLFGVVTFQDLSIAWYRVTWKEEDRIKSLKREARYRAAPSLWNGEKLYAAHLLYGQAITDFCERAIRMRQLVGGGEAWDLANGALTSLAKYKPNAPPVIPSVGHCHGHLIYEGYVDESKHTMWGATRGGETAIRNGDIIEWCDARIQIQDENEQVTTFSFGSGYTSVILSAVEFPQRMDEDAQTLPPIRLPDLEIVMQSAASNMLPTRKLALLSTLVKGRIWIYRPVGWEYVGLNVEPNAEWPPPDPTLYLPS